MKNLQVTAFMRREIEWSHPIALDGLLAAAVARHENLQPPTCLEEVVNIDIPIAREPGGRFHLASNACVGALMYSRSRHFHKRAPHEWYAVLCGETVRRVNVGEQPDKSWRIPRYGYRFDRLTWWCVGDCERIRELLRCITSLGSKRSQGLGRVQEWDVGECSVWDGFPVLRDGYPLRNLPADYPGLKPDCASRMLRITYPYYLREGLEMLACPG